jgi:ABC-type transport system involved in multi-copper enzyme maturation permease subunit
MLVSSAMVATRIGVDARKIGKVARFELAEALRSRLITIVLALYGAGAALGSYSFSRALAAAESAVREQMLGMSAHTVPEDVVRREALPRVIAFFVEDEALRQELVAVDPLAIFYGFTALTCVAPLLVMTSAGLYAQDLASGAARFVLTRCDRLTWSLGKMVGHAALLALGLLVGGLATAVVAQLASGIDVFSVLWLLRAVFRAWVYGLSYLGIFSAISLASRVPSRARALSVVVLVLLWVGHAICRSSYWTARLPPLALAVWLFPTEYQHRLWSPSWLESLPALLALPSLGAVAFATGFALFRRLDA